MDITLAEVKFAIERLEALTADGDNEDLIFVLKPSIDILKKLETYLS